MSAETRSKLIKAARGVFAIKGCASSSMDEITAAAGLTRGALYHHFGGKKGLLHAVITQIDKEMLERLSAIIEQATTSWDGFLQESIAYINMALEPEIQRIMFLEGPAVLGDPSQWSSQNSCLRRTQSNIGRLCDDGILRPVDSLAAAHLFNGALRSVSIWVANSEDPLATAEKAIEGFLILTSGMFCEAD
ncbi:TetR/AcrR family transcriptional regulator [Noviherbaspirillum sp. CPCC 100848]|uniref:TetR/AcrR family transcriptional regulator n=1 Tax=Noviherbaspirillum album TaxID=3080276 RepID=A0ABU6JGD4_9BURK|nr:TetR/AcrR family transcriptional regulator [Noviherbaspirillum sp. CPCC 100848]MEC4722717.1 TetR/AcrR family transcriptional regulator [Noviherbaspirillum sp. CPCC 100848]